MENFDLITAGSLVVNILLAAYAIYSGFNQKKKTLDKELDDLTAKVVDTFKKRVDQLELEVKQIPILEQRITQVENEKRILAEVLNGRDPESLKYKEQTIKAMKEAERTTRVVDRSEKTLNEVLKSIQNLYQLINKHLENESKLIDKNL